MSSDLDIWHGRLADVGKRSFDGMFERAVCEGWEGRVRGFNDVLAMSKGCYFDGRAASHVCEFFPRFLKHSKDPFAGQRFELQDWQADNFLDPVFGWKRLDGTRRCRLAYLEIAKKNGKTTLAAGLGLYMLVADGERGAEVYPGAVNRDQAGLTFEEAARMVEASPHLSSRIEVIRSRKRLLYKKTNSKLEALSADVEAHEGLNISFWIVDELHAHKNRKLYDILRDGGESRKQPLGMIITTAGEYDPTSIGWEMHEYACNVINGTFEDWAFHGAVYCVGKEGTAKDKDDPEKDVEWTDPAIWPLANPSLGVTIHEEGLAARCQEVLNSPDKQNAFKRYRLGIWVQTKDGFVGMDDWNACAEWFDLESLRGRSCYGGLDLSSKEDLSAFVIVCPPTPEDLFYRMMGWFWVPAASLPERAKRNAQPYLQWVNDGHVLTTDGARIDYKAIRRKVEEIGEVVTIEDVQYDPKFAAEIIVDLEAAGIVMVEHAQTCKAMNPGMQALNLNCGRGELRHDGNPAMTWQMGNVIVKTDMDGAVRPDKSNRKKKIDGPASGFMALGRAVQVDVAAGVSRYQTEDLVIV